MLKMDDAVRKMQAGLTPDEGVEAMGVTLPAELDPAESEERLDQLFEQHRNQLVEQQIVQRPKDELSPLDKLRRLMLDELIPVANELREKYEANGLNLRMDAEQFLNGGREIVIEMQFDGIGMRYNGTAITGSIAFQQTRYDVGERSGLTASGTALRTRDLDAAKFRKFICDRIAHLVQQAGKRHR